MSRGKGYWGKSSREIVERPQTQAPQSVQQPVSSRDSEEGRTTYWSANSKGGSIFKADASENSQHATRLLKIAMRNQLEHAPAEEQPRRWLEGNGQRRLITQEEPVQQPRKTTRSSHALPTPDQAYMDAQGDPQPAYYPDTSDSNAH
ncbi:hypothetical protein MMC28_009966 [Mycoblastus sanguinarius]|nr:hypothetical protein [Mycoblastus sanguinarius]